MKKTIPPQTSATNVRQTCRLFPRSGVSALLKKMVTVLAIAGAAGSALAANKFWGGPAGTGAAPVSGTWDTLGVELVHDGHGRFVATTVLGKKLNHKPTQPVSNSVLS